MTACRWLSQVGLSLILLLPAMPAFAGDLYWIYTVRPGDTIWDLSARHTTSVLNWKRLQQVNGLPDVPARGMVPGTRLKFPMDILKHQPVSAQVRLLRGEAQLIGGDGVSRQIAAGHELRSGDRLLVGDTSNVTVQFADGSELLITGGSDVVFDTLSAFGETGMVDTRIRLQSGAVDTRVKSRKGPGSRYEIITPAAVAAVRGTDFRVSADKSQPVSRSEVLEGTVAVSGTGTSRSVVEGYGVVAESGKPPSKPVPLLPPPDLSAQGVTLTQLPLKFAWQDVDGAEAYRYQVADSSSFDSLLVNQTSATQHGQVDSMPNGDYFIRVRGIDDNGLEGLNSTLHFAVAAHPQPPTPANLHSGEVIRTANPVFNWAAADGIHQYRFQLASDADFTMLVTDEQGVRNDRFEPVEALVPARYYWRVASIDDAALQGPWSDAAQFEYRPLPAPPVFSQAEIRRWDIDFKWNDLGEGYRYRFQLAEDADFLETVIDETVAVPGITTHNPGPDRYFIRVMAIDAAGVAGNWSDSEKFEVSGNPWQAILPGLLLIF